MGQLPEHLLAERILVLEDQVMHVPELAMLGGKLSRFGGGLCVWMYFSPREVSKDKPQLFSELLLRRFDDRVCMSAVRTLVVAIFDQRNLVGAGTFGTVHTPALGVSHCPSPPLSPAPI